jgi:hypothetical protein
MLSVGFSLLLRRAITGGLFLAGFAIPARSAPSSPSVPQNPLLVGFALDFFSVSNSPSAAVAKNPLTSPDENILLHAGDPGALPRLRDLIVPMRQEGAAVLRLHVWYRHAEDTLYQPKKDPLGLLVATNGRLPDSDIKHLLAVASTVRAAGYQRLVVVLSPQGSSNPKARRGLVYGAGYDPRLDPLTWGVTEQVVRALHPLGGPDFDIDYDIAPETCPGGTKLLDDKIVAAYQRKMGANYWAEFHDHQFIMSCGAGRAVRGIPALRANETLYRDLGTRPASIDVHIYEPDSAKAVQIVVAANQVAVDLGVPLDINETFYDHPNLFASIRRMRAAHQLPALRQILFWPLRAGSKHAIDLSAPYDIGAVRGSLGLGPGG